MGSLGVEGSLKKGFRLWIGEFRGGTTSALLIPSNTSRAGFPRAIFTPNSLSNYLSMKDGGSGLPASSFGRSLI
jgi:hypothetical protein